MSVQQIVRSHGVTLCVASALILCLFAVQVSSMQSVLTPGEAALVNSFKLKNPNAFDPARRRTVKAMKEPNQSAQSMALGIDAADSELQQDLIATESIEPELVTAIAPR